VYFLFNKAAIDKERTTVFPILNVLLGIVLLLNLVYTLYTMLLKVLSSH
jgi:hypothetical protein